VFALAAGFAVVAGVVTGFGVDVVSTFGVATGAGVFTAGCVDAAGRAAEGSAGGSLPIDAFAQIEGNVFLSISNSMTLRFGFAGVDGRAIGFPLIESFTTAASDRE